MHAENSEKLNLVKKSNNFVDSILTLAYLENSKNHTKFVDIYKIKTFSSKLVVSVLNLKKK